MATTAPTTLPPADATAFDAAYAPALLAAWATWCAGAPDGVATAARLAHAAPPERGRSVLIVRGLDAALRGRLLAIAPPLPGLAARQAPMPSGAAGVPLAALSRTAIDVLIRCAGPASGLAAVDVRALRKGPARFLVLGLALPAGALPAGAAVDGAVRRLAATLAPWRAQGLPIPFVPTHRID